MSRDQERELFWELVETPQERRRRGPLLRLVYALVDPKGWDAGRWGLPRGAVRDAFAAATEMRIAVGAEMRR